jgi:hypothetical protein
MTIFLYFLVSPGDSWQFVQKSTHKAAVVVGRPRGPLFTAARHCGTARNYFPPPVSPKKKEKTIPQKIITPSKTLNGQQQQLKNDRKYAINQ